MKKLMTVAGACLLAACNSGTVTGPDPVETVTQAPEPVAAATPAPQPVVPPPSAQHDARVKGGFYSVTNETSVPQFYCAAAFGVLPGGEQGAGTNLYEDQGIRQSKDVFSGQAPKTAACQYKQIQVDLTQSKDCRKFDWHNVLAAEVYSNPGYIEGTKKVLVSESEAGEWSAYGEYGEWSSWSNENCGTRTRTRTKTRDWFKVEKFECSGEVVKTKIRTETYTDTQTETKDCCAAQSFQLSNLSYPTYNPGSPAVNYHYWDMNQGNDNAKENACVNRGGVWLGDWYNIPNDNSNNLYFDVCRFEVAGPPGNPGADMTFIKTVVKTAAVQPSGGNPISGSATVSGAGVWKLVLKATDPGNYEKDVETKTLTCNSEPFTLTVSYSWIGHSSDDWQLLLYKDNVLVASSAVVNNPSN